MTQTRVQLSWGLELGAKALRRDLYLLRPDCYSGGPLRGKYFGNCNLRGVPPRRIVRGCEAADC